MAEMAEHSTLVFELTRELSRVTAREPFALRLCRAFTRFAGADGAAISLGFATTERTLLCVTDDRVSLFEDVQDTLREGPSLDVFRTQRPVVPGSWEDQARQWPVLMDSLPASVSSTLVHAFPMLPDQVLVGVVSLHLSSGAALSRTPEELDFLADVIGAAIVGGVPVEEGQHAVWTERDQVSQATGVVVAQLGIGPADALAVLRAHAFAHEASVAQISRAVLDRELDFSDPDPKDP
jgi:hypothetical protein